MKRGGSLQRVAGGEARERTAARASRSRIAELACAVAIVGGLVLSDSTVAGAHWINSHAADDAVVSGRIDYVGDTVWSQYLTYPITHWNDQGRINITPDTPSEVADLFIVDDEIPLDSQGREVPGTYNTAGPLGNTLTLDWSWVNHRYVNNLPNPIHNVILHEFGHALGLDHQTVDTPALMEPFVTDLTTANVHDRGDYGYAHGLGYQVHMRDLGWGHMRGQGDTGGTEGQNRPLEAIKVWTNQGNSPSVTVYCTAHVQNVGWMTEDAEGGLCGTTGLVQNLEAVRLRLVNPPAGYSVTYRCHVAGIGWQPWVSNNAVCGTVGQNRAIEAIQGYVVPA